MGAASDSSFAELLLAWFRRHGRHDLPWQLEPSPYRVWVSEIMLQQTQVATVIPYYERFLGRFPDLIALAAASLDEVLRHWSGLGYYARARHLHQAAQRLLERYQGRFPEDLAALQELPGIGRSTAGAILSLGMGRRAPILDGNVKRVLCRCFAVPGWPGGAATQRVLWELTEGLLPKAAFGAYNQALMDLGAGVCRRTQPRCGDCPVRSLCAAYREGAQDRFPEPPPRRGKPVREAYWLLVQEPGSRLLLERRPPTGIWGGLWSLPECAPGADIERHCREQLGLAPLSLEFWPRRRHTFTHFRLDYTPVWVWVGVAALPAVARELDSYCWQVLERQPPGGLPQPVAQLIDELTGRAPGRDS